MGTKSYLKLIPAGEISFLQWRVSGYIKHIPGWALCPGRVGQNKMDSMVLYVHAFVLFLLYFLILLSFYILFFFFFFFLRQRIWSCIGKKRENIIKVHCMNYMRGRECGVG